MMPPIGLALGGVDFANFFVVLKGDRAVDTLAAAKAAKDVTINYGLFINAIINFLIVAFVLFMLLRQLNKLVAPKPETEAAPPPPEEVLLLREIRDTLKDPLMKSRSALASCCCWRRRRAARPTIPPAAAANAFYSVYSGQHAQGGGIPDATARVRLRRCCRPASTSCWPRPPRREARLTAKVKNRAARAGRRSFLLSV